MSNQFLPLAKPPRRRDDLAAPRNIPSMGSVGIRQGASPALSESPYRATNMSQIFSLQPNQFQISEEEDDIDMPQTIQTRGHILAATRGTKMAESVLTQDTFLSRIREDDYKDDVSVLSKIRESESEAPSTRSTQSQKDASTMDTRSEVSLFFDEPEGHRPAEFNPRRKRSFLYRLKNRWIPFYKELVRFKGLKLIQVLLACYVCFLTYADIGPPGGLQDENGLILDRQSPERTEMGLILVNGVERAIIGATKFQVIAVGISRMSAFFMYPGKLYL
jgi:hypothetical protein